MPRLICFFCWWMGCVGMLQAQEIGLLKYQGGGDWYANPTSLPNLIAYANSHGFTQLAPKPAVVTPDSPDLFQYPFIHMTGHGNVVFSEAERIQLRRYLLSGGFLHIDDNYGMDVYIRREIKALFPDKSWVELPANHPIFQKPYPFPKGLPKIHEHDNQKPEALGIIHDGRLILLYTHECDLGDGWEDAEVHNDPREVRESALRMGTNLLFYVFNK